MVNLIKEGLLNVKWVPRLESLRFRRVNVQRPRAPHYERAKYIELVKPIYKENESIYLPPSVKCRKKLEIGGKKIKIDNPLEKIIAKELYEKFESSQLIGFLHTNSISGEKQFQARVLLMREGIEIGIYSKKTVEVAVRRTIYEAILPLFVSNNAIVFSKEICVDKLKKVLRKIPEYVLLAGIVDRRLLNVSQLDKYAELKDITTARAGLVALLGSFGQNVVNNLIAHPCNLTVQLQMYSETKAENK